MKIFTRDSFATIFQLIIVIVLFVYPDSWLRHSSQQIPVATKTITADKPYMNANAGMEEFQHENSVIDKATRQPFDTFSFYKNGLGLFFSNDFKNFNPK